MLPPWARRKTLSNKAHNEIIDQVNRNSEMTGTGDIYPQGGPGGNTIVDLRNQPYDIRVVAAVIAPESSTYTYTDPRYRCKVQKVISGSLPEDIVTWDNEDDPNEQHEGLTSPSGSTDVPVGWTATATNLAEVTDPTTGDGTHDIAEDGTVLVEMFGRRAYIPGDDHATIHWYFSRTPTKACGDSIIIIGRTTEGTEAADTATFDFTTGVGTNAAQVDIWVQTGTAYFEAGDETLYAYFRKLTFTCKGGSLNLTQISGEIRVVVDVPEAC